MRRTLLSFGTLALALVLLPGCTSLSSSGDQTSGPAGVFVTADAGETWQAASIVPTREGNLNKNASSVYRMVQDPQDPDALYWLTRGEGMYYSYDAGNTWNVPPAPINQGFMYDIVVHPKDKCTLYVTNGRRIYQSTDCSRSFVEVYEEARTNTGIQSLTMHAFPPYDVYAATNKGDVIRSVDAGNSWQVVRRLDRTIRRIVADPTQANTLYVATTDKGLYRTTDAGVNWEALGEQLSEYSRALNYRRFEIDPAIPGKIYWISEYGILYSLDRGDTWEPMRLITAPGSADIWGFTVNPRNPKEMYYTSTNNTRQVFFRTVDGGENWETENLPSGQIPTMLHAHAERDLVYVGFTIPPEQ
jgi:photosystem II stability/assembly factor-like uncharacterized protein